MENLKILVNSADESKEAQELFLGLGYVKENWLWSGYSDYPIELRTRDGGYSDFNLNAENAIERKEITLPELRAMVNPMKEYLMPSRNYEYILTDAREALEPHAEDWIEIPEGAIRARFYPHDPDELEFENAFRQWWHDENQGWFYYNNYAVSEKHSRVVWQRATHPEELPFIDDEPKSINDQCAEIEQVGQVEIHGTAKAKPDFNFGAAQASGGVDATLAERQSTYGNFEDVAFVTENIMSILAKVRVNGLDDLPNTHRMALYMIASKMARIVNGDFSHLDSWHDIGGYAKLIEKLIKGE